MMYEIEQMYREAIDWVNYYAQNEGVEFDSPCTRYLS